jgi:hypothetical protein
MCRIEDAEPWSWYNQEQRRAAKEHTCTECRRIITKGETYDYAVGKYDSYISTFKTCQHCTAARAWLTAACGGWLYAGVLEELQEHWDEEPELRSTMLQRLIAGMQERWEGRVVPDVELVRASVPVMARA